MLLTDAIDAVANRLAVRGLKPGTISEYVDEATAFAEWFERAEGHRASVADVSIVSADRYVLSLINAARERGVAWSAGTRGHHVRQLRAFAGHLAVVLGLESNPLAGFSPGAKPRRREGDALRDDELLAVLDAVNPRSPYDIVTGGIVALGYEVGPRTSELAAMDVADFTMATDGGTQLGPIVRVEDPAKNGPRRVLPLGVRAEDILIPIVGNRKSGPLFPARGGVPISGKALHDRVKNIGERAGVHLNPQRLRRSAASWQATYGASNGHLDKVFGWEPDPRDVKSGHYIIPTEVQLIYAHQTRLSPLDRLELRVGRPLG